MKIQAKNFTLRHFKSGDENSLIENINDYDIYKLTASIPYPYTKKDASDWIQNCLLQYKLKNPKGYSLAIEKDGNVIGGIGFGNIERSKAEFGYWLGKK